MRSLRSISESVRMRLYTRETVMIYRAPIYVDQRERPIPEVRYASYRSLEDLRWFHSPEELVVFRRFLDAGHVGYLAYVDGRCVHRTWLVPGPAQVNEHWSRARKIGPEEAFVHYVLTASEARGMGVFPTVLNKVVEDTKGTVTTMAIAEENLASRRAAVKAGWRPVRATRFMCLGGIRWQSEEVAPD